MSVLEHDFWDRVAALLRAARECGWAESDEPQAIAWPYVAVA
jgi:hypothetical protein